MSEQSTAKPDFFPEIPPAINRMSSTLAKQAAFCTELSLHSSGGAVVRGEWYRLYKQMMKHFMDSNIKKLSLDDHKALMWASHRGHFDWSAAD